MADVKMTAGSVLGTVTTAAAAVGEVFDSVGNGARYINNFAKKKLAEQELIYAADAEEFESHLVETRAMQDAERAAEIDRYCADPDNLDRYTKATKRYQAAIDAAKAKIAARNNG